MVIAMVIARTAMAASKAVHRLPPAINRAMVNETRISGRGTSKMALTPEKRPCWLSGTRSGISACWAACAALAATANTRAMPKKIQKPAMPVRLVANPIAVMQISAPTVPPKMKGRRRPKRSAL